MSVESPNRSESEVHPLGGIFVSYRRDDTKHVAGRLFDRLAERYGPADIFMDVDSIEPGQDFDAVIDNAISQCRALLVLIGRSWLHANNESGRRRIDEPNDLVVMEIVRALARDIRVVPILIDGANAPRPADLPKVLAPMARRNAIRIDHETFNSDVKRLIGILDQEWRPVKVLTDVVESSGVHSEGGLVTFGGRARLRPTPVKVAKQSPRALEHVPDIAIDWLDTTFAEVRALSARGHMHRYLGNLRQDSFAIELTEPYLVVAVADGVGTGSESHHGSAMAVRESVRAADVLEAIVAASEVKREVSLAPLAAGLTYEARRNGLEPQQVATTLVLAIVSAAAADDGSRKVVVAQIGDSTAWRHRSNEWHQLGEVEKREVGTMVEMLPFHSNARVWCETFRAGETLALVSDGVGELLHYRVGYERELSALWRECAPAPGNLLNVVDATVKSFDDDRTFVGVRFR